MQTLYRLGWKEESQVQSRALLDFAKDVSDAIKYEGSTLKSESGPTFAAVSEEQKRAHEMASALDWLKNNDADLDMDDDVSVATDIANCNRHIRRFLSSDVSVAMSVATFKKIDSLMPKSGDNQGITSMENALAWLRSKTDVDDATVNSFKKLDNVMSKSGVKDSIRIFYFFVIRSISETKKNVREVDSIILCVDLLCTSFL